MLKRLLLFILIECFFSLGGQAQSLMYFCTSNGKLYKFNSKNCVKSYVGNLTSNLYDIAMTPDGKLYGVFNNFLLKVDTSNASVTLIGNIGNGTTFNSLVSDASGNLLSVFAGKLYKINRLTAQPTLLGSYGNYPSAGDLTFYKDTLFLSAEEDKLVRINLVPPISSQLIGTMPAGNIYGINTVCLNGEETMIASANGLNVEFYKVNTANASLTLICNLGYADSIGAIYGATSQRDFVVQPTITQNGNILSAPQTYFSYQWYFNNTLIPGATSYNYMATQSGDYTVLVQDDNGCSTGSSTLNFVTGINANVSSAFSISPNPTSGTINFQLTNDTKIALIEIYNTFNVRVYSDTFYDNKGTVPQKFPPGIYFVRVTSVGKQSVTKLVVK